MCKVPSYVAMYVRMHACRPTGKTLKRVQSWNSGMGRGYHRKKKKKKKKKKSTKQSWSFC